MAIIAIAMFVALILGQAHTGPLDQLWGPGYTIVATHGTYSIIIDEQFAPRFVEAPERESVETWTPTREDVIAAETLLVSLRPGDAIDAQRRQEAESPEDLVSRTWYGVIVDGERIMYVNGYCDGGMPDDPLMPVFVADGGSCYWNAAINADTWEIVSYLENGNA